MVYNISTLLGVQKIRYIFLGSNLLILLYISFVNFELYETQLIYGIEEYLLFIAIKWWEYCGQIHYT